MVRHKVLRSPRSARKERRKKSRKILLLSFLFLAAVGGIAYGFSRPEFRITSIEVIGSMRVSEEEIRSTMLEGISGALFGFIPKSHTLLYPKATLKESLLKKFPTFSGVSISLRNLSTLRVFVHEREPQALWCTSEWDCFFIDKTGFVFAPADTGTEQMYYHLEKRATSSPLGTETIEHEKLGALLLFLKKLEDMELNPEKALFKEQDELEIVLRGGARLLLREDGYNLALINLKTLMEQDDLFSKRNGTLSVAYIDLRYGNKIYFKPK